MASSELSLASQGSVLTTLRSRFAFLEKRALAVIDQALFAGSNFIFNILLARSLSPADYGAFAFAFSLLLLVGAIHTAAITEPMMVFGPGKFCGSFRRYLALLIIGHVLVVLPLCVLLACTGVLAIMLHSTQIGMALLGASAAGPLILSLWLSRRAFYVHLRPGWSVVAGALYLGSVLFSVWLLKRENWISPLAAFVAMGICAFLVSVASIALHHPSWNKAEEPSARTVWNEHWNYGRWSVATVLLNWVPTNISYVVLPLWLGLGTAGALRAILNLVMPALQAIGAMSLVLMPMLVKDRERCGIAGMNRTMALHTAMLSIACACYLCVLLSARHFIVHFMYSGKYDHINIVSLLLAGLLPFSLVPITTIGNGLRALERPDRIFWCYVAATAVSLLLGLPLGIKFGVTGAIAGEALAGIITAALMFTYYRHIVREYTC